MNAPEETAPYLADGVGIANGASDSANFHMPSFGPVNVKNGQTAVQEFFATSYVDLQIITPEVPAVPFVAGLVGGNDEGAANYRFSHLWFLAAKAGGGLPGNHRMLIGAATSDEISTVGVTTQPYYRTSYCFNGRIEEQFKSNPDLQGLDINKFKFMVTAHELAHQWAVNFNPVPSGGDGFGHCKYRSFNGVRNCRMHALDPDPAHRGDQADGILEFHYEKVNNLADSEYLTIRHALEPMP